METRKHVVLLLKCEIRRTPGDHQDQFWHTCTLKYLVTFPSGATSAAGLQRITLSTAVNRTRSLVENRVSGSNWSMCQIILIDSFITQQLRRAAALWMSPLQFPPWETQQEGFSSWGWEWRRDSQSAGNWLSDIVSTWRWTAQVIKHLQQQQLAPQVSDQKIKLTF